MKSWGSPHLALQPNQVDLLLDRDKHEQYSPLEPMSDSARKLGGPAVMLVGVEIPKAGCCWDGLGVFLDFLPNRRFIIVPGEGKGQCDGITARNPTFLPVGACKQTYTDE